MESGLHSPSWYKVAGLRPKVRPHVRFSRQIFRSEIWYVLEDRASGRFHRFSPSAYLVVTLMNGRRTVQEIWDTACARLGDDTLMQEEAVRLLIQLHQADVLLTDVNPDFAAVTDRTSKMRRKKRAMTFINPLAIRIPIFDPDEFLTALLPVVRPLFSWFGVLLFLGVVVYGLILAGIHWEPLTGNIVDRILATESLLLLVVTYPLVKALHELGHGFAVKHWGGDVHEIGVIFLVFMPVPYVDASAASAFRQKWRKAAVGAMGIMVELFLAAVAMMVWVNAEEGLVRAFAFNVMVIGGVSSLFFNGNPLLRFDGYYVFSDILEIPNLGNRANRYLGYLIQRYAFGVKTARSPEIGRSERGWLFFYSIAAFIYRLFIMAAIVTFVALQFFVVGVLLAIWAVIMTLVVPFSKQVWFLLTSPVLRENRTRAFIVSGLTGSAVFGVLMGVPVPYATVVEGVLWVPGESIIHAPTSGTVDRVLVPSGKPIEPGMPVVRLSEPLLDAEVAALEARVDGLAVKYAAASVEDPSKAKVIGEELKYAYVDLQRARRRAADLIVRSPASGEFVLRKMHDLEGSFVEKGDIIGYALHRDNPSIRVVVREAVANIVEDRTQSIEVRLADDIDTIHAGRIVRTLPLITDKLPTPVLSTAGGGTILMDPTDPEDVTALEKFRELEIRLNEVVDVRVLGGRTFVRFYHGTEPVVWRMYRAVRQVFLSKFHV